MLFSRAWIYPDGIEIRDFMVHGQSELTEILTLNQLIELVDNQVYLAEGHEELVPMSYDAAQELAKARYQVWARG